MKKSNVIITIVVIIIIVILAIWGLSSHVASTGSTSTTTTNATIVDNLNGNKATTTSAAVVQNATVSNTLSKYENDELGFSLQYPTAWSVTENPVGPLFTIPLANRTTSITTLNSSVYIASGKCAFPPVAPSSIQTNTTVKFGTLSYSMIAVATSSKGSNYFNRMYTLQQGTTKNPLCYLFAFAAVSSSVNSNNQPVITSADNAFTAMVKSFAFVTTPAGDSETAHPEGQ